MAGFSVSRVVVTGVSRTGGDALADIEVSIGRVTGRPPATQRLLCR
jgi:hypothetical protein